MEISVIPYNYFQRYKFISLKKQVGIGKALMEWSSVLIESRSLDIPV